MGQIFPAAHVLIEETIGAPFNDAFLHELVDMLADNAEMQGQLGAATNVGG
jgi:hypothetical protein